MPTQGEGAIGSLDYSSDERKVLAKRSITFTCSTCKIDSSVVLPALTDKSNQECAEAKELAAQIQFKVLFLVILFCFTSTSNKTFRLC
jgi:ubiquitin-conjugating enzyme E2 J1